ncbi:MAG: starch-binding protein [Muribaculaceae bacterium]|nr:starch-binding protein [Muribaculaceae bacterium]
MRKIYIILAMALLLPLTTLAQGWPANYGGVMLQGFFWDSYKETPDCSPWGPWANHVTNEATATHQPGYTWATMYGAGWTSGEEWQVPVTTWTSLIAHKDEITPYIDLLWLPQSGSTVADSTMVYYESEDNSGRHGERPWRNGYDWGYNDNNVITNPDCMGFVPVFYFHHGLSLKPDGTPWTYTDSEGRTWTPISYFGTEQELRDLISIYKSEGTGAIEDVVANHRGGLGTWAGDKYSIEFPTEWYQGTFCPEGEMIEWSSDDVCSDDESGRGTGNPDCGGKGEWARDIDHHSPATRLKVLKFLDFLKNDLGYVGYRYDYAMGFEEKHFAEYNTTLRPTFSVGEYWGSKGDISSWIHKTYMEGTYQSAAFDFPLQSDIREAFNYGNYRYLNNSGLISDPVLKRYAVTFLDNHDTFKDLPTDGSNYNWSNGKSYQHRIEKNIVEANAFILAMPGTPCLFYPHFMHPEWHETLCTLIKARRTAGITNESERSAAELVGDNGIQWVVTGANGQVCFQLGDAAARDSVPPEGFTTVWQSDPDENGYRVARYSITSSLYNQIEYNKKKNLINGYPVIDKNNTTFAGSITVNVKPSTEECTLVYTTDGTMPNNYSPTIKESTDLTFTDNTTLKVGVLVDYDVPTSSVVTRQYVKTATESNKINFYVKDDNAPYLYVYYYDNNGNKYEPFGAWRGYLAFEQVQVGGINWWHVQMDKPEYPVSLIINWEGSQTPDITGITSDVFYTVQEGQPNDVTGTYMPMMENPDLAIDKPTGSYKGGISAKITSSYSAATIVYTTDGTAPTVNSPTIASGGTVSFNTNGTHYLRAGIVMDGQVIKQQARSYFVEDGHGEGVNIYVKNMTTSDAPHIYAWNANEEPVTDTFENGGDKLGDTQPNCGQTWYKKHFDEVPAGFFFMLSGDKDKCATINYVENGHDYYFYYYPGAHFGNDGFQPGYIDVTADSKHTTDVKAITVFMYDNGNADWSNIIKLYPYINDSQIFWNWGGSWAESAFPTTDMGGQSWFYCTFMDKENINAILFDSTNDSQRLTVTGIDSDVFMKFPKTNDNWSTGENLTDQYAQYLPDVEKPEEGEVTPEETVIPTCANTAGLNGFYCFFENSDFGSPYAWVYSGTKTFGEHGWPGEALIEVAGTAPSGNLVYRWTYNGYGDEPSDVIFSNKGDNQTRAFEFVNGGYYTSEGLVGMAHDNIMTLAQLSMMGQPDKEYIIANDINTVIALTRKDDIRIFAKDADGDAVNLSENFNNLPVPEIMQGWTFDQSNWVEISLPQDFEMNIENVGLLGNTIRGRLIESFNTQIEFTINPLVEGETNYTPNNFLVANFDTMHSDYFLVRPKAQEYANLKYAIYRDDKLTMANQTGPNEWEIPLDGEVSLNNDQAFFQGDVPLNEFLEENGVYNMQVIAHDNGRKMNVIVINAEKIGTFVENTTPLADVLESGVNNTEYKIADDLAVAAAPMEKDFAFLTDGNDNWIKVVFEPGSEAEGVIIESFMTQNAIKGGTLKGTLSDIELNPFLTLSTTVVPEIGEAPVDYEIETVNLSEEFVLKENQVVDVKGYWNDNDGALRAYAPSNAIQGQSLSLTTEWLDGVKLDDGTFYQVRAAITLKEPWQNPSTDGIGLLDYDYDFQNYLAHALEEPSSNIPTGVVDINNGLIAVRYYNLQGIELATPTQGVNIVVREYDNGKCTVSKVLFK